MFIISGKFTISNIFRRGVWSSIQTNVRTHMPLLLSSNVTACVYVQTTIIKLNMSVFAVFLCSSFHRLYY